MRVRVCLCLCLSFGARACRALRDYDLRSADDTASAQDATIWNDTHTRLTETDD